MTREIGWRRPIASLNYLLTSHVWRQDHNGFSHQDPGFIDHVVNKKAEVIRVYLPPDANTPAVGHRPLPAQPALRQRHRRRQAAGARLPDHGRGGAPLRARHRHLGLGQQRRGRPGRGDGLRRRHPDARDARRGRRPPPSSCPTLRVRVVNVVDLMRLQPDDGASPRPARPRVRCPVHDRPAGHLRLPRLSVADPPAGVSTHQPRQPPRARLQGGGDRHDPLRHGHAQRPRPVSTW